MSGPIASGLHQVRDVRADLKRAGLRSTPQRLAVLTELRSSKSPLSHKELCARLDGTYWDQTTVFRALNSLVEADLVRRVDFGDRIWRFELTSQAVSPVNHLHFFCIDCGSIACLQGTDLASAVEALKINSDGAIAVHEIVIRGKCGNCPPQAVATKQDRGGRNIRPKK